MPKYGLSLILIFPYVDRILSEYGSEKARILTHFMHCLGKYFQSLHRPTRKYKLWQCAKVIREQIYELFNCAKIKRVKIRGTQSLM